MARKPIMAANWKMHKTAPEAEAFAEGFLPLVADAGEVDIVVAPPFTALDRLGRALAGSSVALAAQNVNPEAKGAFTGEISTGMLKDLGCSYTIVGHSERRALYGETDAFIAAKAQALLDANIRPIVCCGETNEEREANRTLDVVGGQLDGSLAGLPNDCAGDIVIAYEPVWAIGTGKTANARDGSGGPRLHPHEAARTLRHGGRRCDPHPVRRLGEAGQRGRADGPARHRRRPRRRREPRAGQLLEDR